MPVQEGAGGSEAMDQSPTPGVMLRSTLEDAGQALFSADGGTLYFQPDSFSENGGKLMVWDPVRHKGLKRRQPACCQRRIFLHVGE